MSSVNFEAASTTDRHLFIRLLDQPSADIVLRSQDSHHIEVPKIYVVNSSPILGELIQKALDCNANAEESLPVLQLPECGEILECLLTFVFPVTPRVPSTFEEIMKLLSVAQKYQMGAALSHIRAIIAQQNLLPTSLEPALHLYGLAQKYSLRPEALQAAQSILKYPMTIENFYNKLDIMPSAFLYELWKYRKEVRAILASDLTAFRRSAACSTITGLRCTELSSSQIPSWLDRYIESIGKAPNLFDTAEFNIALARHTKDKANEQSCECASIPSQTVRDFWEALASVVYGGFKKAESALCLQVLKKKVDPRAQINSTTRAPKTFDVSDANLIIRSSDLVDFRVHKSVLAMVSPFFQRLLSLPQHSESESVDGLPVVQLSENSELLKSLISLLYPIPIVVPNAYEKVLYLLSACRKYEMPSIQLLIRDRVIRKQFPKPIGTQAFPAYAIASARELLLEVKCAASSTLKYPMTFETLGKRLRIFKGRALRDLADYRKRCKDNMVTCLDSYLNVQPSGPSSIWVGCPEVMPSTSSLEKRLRSRALPIWLNECLSRCRNDLTSKLFTRPLVLGSNIWTKFVTAHGTHSHCKFCKEVKARKGFEYISELERKLRQAIDEVRRDYGSHFRSTSRQVIGNSEVVSTSTMRVQYIGVRATP